VSDLIERRAAEGAAMTLAVLGEAGDGGLPKEELAERTGIARPDAAARLRGGELRSLPNGASRLVVVTRLWTSSNPQGVRHRHHDLALLSGRGIS
jgi:hypothetical protein